MGAFVFDKCCFCIELKTGCFLIAYLSLIGYSILTVLGIVGIIGGSILTTKGNDDETNNILNENKFNSFANFPKDENAAQAAQVTGVAIIVVSALLLLIVVFMLTFVIVLLVGLHKNKPGHLKAYLVYACIFIVLSILGLIGSAVSSDGNKSIAQGIVNIIWNIYTTLIIRSQYFAIKSPERGPAIYSAA